MKFLGTLLQAQARTSVAHTVDPKCEKYLSTLKENVPKRCARAVFFKE
jgi:hypothetical protein